VSEMRFYKETIFKETPIGRIPKEWEVVKLGDITTDVYRYPTYYNIKYVDNGVPEVRGELIKDSGELDEDLSKYRFISKETCQRFRRTILHEGDFVLSVRGTMGKVAVVPKHMEGANITANLMKISLKQSKCSPEFFKQVFLSNTFGKTLEDLSSHTTIKTIQSPILKSIKVPLPSIPEQQKIAEILSTIDEAIQKTDEIIAKTERLKKGLMQELLTKGIGHKEFKDTEIGRIPKDWEVVKLGETVEINKDSRDPQKDIPNEIFTYIDIDSIEGSTGKIRNPQRILGRDAPSRARRVVHEYDVIMSTVRPYLKAFAMVPKDYDNQICSTGFAVLSCKDTVLPYFLLNVLFSDTVTIQCNKLMMGGQYPALNQSQVSKIKIPLPTLPEQQRIAEVFSVIDQKLELEREKKAKLERIKQGMMDLLLTGKVRVEVN